MRNRISKLGLLFRSLPPIFTALYFLSVILMNLLAGKELINLPYLALDCGSLISWVPFLFMDMMCKYYGPVEAAQVAVTALLVNLLCCILFMLVSAVPGHWSEYYNVAVEYSQVVDMSLNRAIGGSWYVLMGSTVSMFLSSVANSSVFAFVSRFTNSDSFGSFAVRSYVSTTIGQFVDNFTFTAIVSHVIFDWSWVQVFVCASTGTLFELLLEIIFSPLSFRVCLQWKRLGIGSPYLENKLS